MNTKSKQHSGIKVTSAIRAGALTANHSRAGLKVQSAFKAGRGIFVRNHNLSMA